VAVIGSGLYRFWILTLIELGLLILVARYLHLGPNGPIGVSGNFPGNPFPLYRRSGRLGPHSISHTPGHYKLVSEFRGGSTPPPPPSVRQCTRCNIPEEGRPQLNCYGSLNLRQHFSYSHFKGCRCILIKEKGVKWGVGCCAPSAGSCPIPPGQ
jgi:hypothetical protein